MKERKQRKKETGAPEPDTKKKDDGEGNYMSEGMCIGLALGLAFGQSVFHNAGIGMCMGLSIGMLLGMSIPKKPAGDKAPEPAKDQEEKAEKEKKENGEETENHAEN